MRSKQVPEIIKFMKKSKKVKSNKNKKTSVFTIQIRGWDIRNQHNFNLKINNNHAGNPNMLFDASNVRKYQKVKSNENICTYNIN